MTRAQKGLGGLNMGPTGRRLEVGDRERGDHWRLGVYKSQGGIRVRPKIGREGSIYSKMGLGLALFARIRIVGS